MKLENIKSKILPPFDNVGIGHAVRYGEWLFISGQIPIDKEGHIVGKMMLGHKPYKCIK